MIVIHLVVLAAAIVVFATAAAAAAVTVTVVATAAAAAAAGKVEKSTPGSAVIERFQCIFFVPDGAHQCGACGFLGFFLR